MTLKYTMNFLILQPKCHSWYYFSLQSFTQEGNHLLKWDRVISLHKTFPINPNKKSKILTGPAKSNILCDLDSAYSLVSSSSTLLQCLQHDFLSITMILDSYLLLTMQVSARLLPPCNNFPDNLTSCQVTVSLPSFILFISKSTYLLISTPKHTHI